MPLSIINISNANEKFISLFGILTCWRSILLKMYVTHKYISIRAKISSTFERLYTCVGFWRKAVKKRLRSKGDCDDNFSFYSYFFSVRVRFFAECCAYSESSVWLEKNFFEMKEGLANRKTRIPLTSLATDQRLWCFFLLVRNLERLWIEINKWQDNKLI